MPGPLDYLKQGWDFANSSIFPQDKVRQAQDFIDSPSLTRSPGEAQLQGFLAGSLGGLADQFTPMNLALTALGKAVPMGKIGQWGTPGRILENAAGKIHTLNPRQVGNMERMYQEANPVFKGLENAGNFAGDRSVGGIARSFKPQPSVPSTFNPIQETLGEMSSEFTPVGGESMFNMGRPPAPSIEDPVERAYKAIKSRGGR